jgi:hypothetical protein
MSSFQIKRSLRLDEVTDICDVNSHFEVAIVQRAAVQSIINIFAARRINGDDGEMTEISSLRNKIFSNLPVAWGQTSHDLCGKLITGDSVFMEQHLGLHFLHSIHSQDSHIVTEG